MKESRYGIQLEFPDAPLLKAKPTSKNTFLPIELVYMSQQKLPGVYDDDLKSALAESMCMDPDFRRRYIEEKVKEVLLQNPILEEFGLSIDPNMTKWKAEVLPTPDLQYRMVGPRKEYTVRKIKSEYCVSYRFRCIAISLLTIYMLWCHCNYVNNGRRLSPSEVRGICVAERS